MDKFHFKEETIQLMLGLFCPIYIQMSDEYGIIKLLFINAVRGEKEHI